MPSELQIETKITMATATDPQNKSRNCTNPAEPLYEGNGHRPTKQTQNMQKSNYL